MSNLIGNGSIRQHLMQQYTLDVLMQLVQSPNKSIQRQASWILSSIAVDCMCSLVLTHALAKFICACWLAKCSKKLIKAGLLKAIVQNLYSTDRQCQEEAVWALANISANRVCYRLTLSILLMCNVLIAANGELILEANTLPKLVELLLSKDKNVQMQAVWGIANLTVNGESLLHVHLS